MYPPQKREDPIALMAGESEDKKKDSDQPTAKSKQDKENDDNSWKGLSGIPPWRKKREAEEKKDDEERKSASYAEESRKVPVTSDSVMPWHEGSSNSFAGTPEIGRKVYP